MPDSLLMFGALVFLFVFLGALSMCQVAADADRDLEEGEQDWLWPDQIIGKDGKP